MKNLKRGFVSSFLIIIIAALVIGGGTYIYSKTKAPNQSMTSNSSITSSDCGTTNKFLTSDQRDGIGGVAYENDSTLACLGNHLLQNCSHSSGIIKAKGTTLSYEIVGGGNCVVKIINTQNSKSMQCPASKLIMVYDGAVSSKSSMDSKKYPASYIGKTLVAFDIIAQSGNSSSLGCSGSLR